MGKKSLSDFDLQEGGHSPKYFESQVFSLGFWNSVNSTKENKTTTKQNKTKNHFS